VTHGTRAPRAIAAALGLALLVLLSLNWFGVRSAPARQDFGEGGVLNLLNTYSAGGIHASGWAGLSPFAVTFLLVAAVAVVAGRGAPAVGVSAIALVVLVVALLTRDDDLALRWPAYVGGLLSVALLGCATWSWRAR
jgi:hypothetical protein